MKLEVLGTNAAFAPKGINNSFILWKTPDDGILLDCGFSVFQELVQRDYAAKVNTVLLSHLHQDHCGSLVNLLDYRYKILGLKTELGGVQTEEFLKTHSGDGWQDKITPVTNVLWSGFEVPHAKGMECRALMVEDRLLYSGDSAISILDTAEAEKAKMIIHDVSLSSGGIIVAISALKDAAPEIKAKTFVSHYLPKDYDTLAYKAEKYGLGGVLKAGDNFNL